MENQRETALVIQPRLEQPVWARRRKAAIRFMLTKPLGATGLIIVIVATFVAVFAPVFAPHDPRDISTESILLSPNATYWFGTDTLGRDILSRTMFGARISIMVGVVSMLAASLIGTVIGITSAHFGGWYDLGRATIH